jgi:HSP20 family protein
MKMADIETTEGSRQAVATEEQTRPERSYRPNVDILETSDGLRLWADLPGVDEKSVEVDLVDDVLSIRARVSVAEYENRRPLYTEYNVGSYEARFRVSDAIDGARISAKLANGVLELALPKVETAKLRKIQIN